MNGWKAHGLVYIVMVLVCAGCSTTSEENQEASEEATRIPQLDEDSDGFVEFSEDTKQLLTLYQEFLRFKDDPEFHQIGFGVCCRFNDWQRRVEELSSRAKLKTLKDIGVMPGDLFNLGMEYLRSKGQPTDSSREFEPQLEAGLAAIEASR